MRKKLQKTKRAIHSQVLSQAYKEEAEFSILSHDPYLTPHASFFYEIHEKVAETVHRLTQGNMSLLEFASGHEYFGLHKENGEWVIREWAPNVREAFLIGPFSDWQPREEFRFQSLGHGSWELRLPANALRHHDLYRLFFRWDGGGADRIPAWVRRVVQDDQTKIFSAQVWDPPHPYEWQHDHAPRLEGPLFIYEAHVGMAQEEEKTGSFLEFRDNILPRIKDAGYTAIQLMAVQEHPYYGSFGYQISSFFAPSSRFGTPEELRELIDSAHEMGLAVFLDIVHSHAVKNEVEGISCYDGTHYQFFHHGPRGEHPVWDSRLFNYGKTEVLHFLLSNVRYWIDAFHFDGFRFDGVTSMLYHDHGLGDPFSSYDCYFGSNLDHDALVYLALANQVAHATKEDITTVAEDVSGFPGLAAPLSHGGFGFDYRLAMGIPDFWIRTIKSQKDEDWNVDWMFAELTNRRADEKTISYAESHDQALVGDQTIIFRLLQTLMYDSMKVSQKNPYVDRGLALHRLIRLMTLSLAGHGYLNFMGNEFGHPEWVDFPRDGNGWSYKHARRLWSLRDNDDLQYSKLAEFDKALLNLLTKHEVFRVPYPYKHFAHVHDQVLTFSRGDLFFVVSFNPHQSFEGYPVDAPEGKFELVFNTDDECFGGNGRKIQRAQGSSTKARKKDSAKIMVDLPTRTGLVFCYR